MRISLAVFSLAMLLAAAPAKADYFVWEDPQSGLTLSYPDTWRMGSHRQPDEVFTIIAPAPSASPNDDAVCRVRVRDDKRFLIYPPHRAGDIQPVAYSEDFWRTYLNEYENVELFNFIDGAGLGRGFGSFAVAGFDGAIFSPYSNRRGIAAASLYFGKVYVVDCSSRTEVFEKWQPLFLSIMGSVDFKKAHHELSTGDYRNFLSDSTMQFVWPRKDAVNRY